jgi:hypothetical protein
MVRVDQWSQPRKDKYVLVEYIHHSGLIDYEEFDTTRWSFQMHLPTPNESKDCLSWMARGPSFLPTAFGAKITLPDPKVLPCLVTDTRPSAVGKRNPNPPTPD